MKWLFVPLLFVSLLGCSEQSRNDFRLNYYKGKCPTDATDVRLVVHNGSGSWATFKWRDKYYLFESGEFGSGIVEITKEQHEQSWDGK